MDLHISNHPADCLCSECLATVLEFESKATPGPWYRTGNHIRDGRASNLICKVVIGRKLTQKAITNLAFIAFCRWRIGPLVRERQNLEIDLDAAHEDVEQLTKNVEHYQAERDDLKQRLAEAEKVLAKLAIAQALIEELAEFACKDDLPLQGEDCGHCLPCRARGVLDQLDKE